MRILNIHLQPGKESKTQLVMDTIYQQLLLPILEGAKASEEIHTIPSREALLETAHILPGKGPKKPIIARFYSCYWRSLIFQYRKDFAPREESPANITRRGAERTTSPFTRTSPGQPSNSCSPSRRRRMSQQRGLSAVSFDSRSRIVKISTKSRRCGAQSTALLRSEIFFLSYCSPIYLCLLLYQMDNQ